MTGAHEGLKLRDGDRIAGDLKGIHLAGRLVDDFRVRVLHVFADLKRHLAAVHLAPVDVGEAVRIQTRPLAAVAAHTVAEQRETHADLRAGLVGERQAPGVAVAAGAALRIYLGTERRQRSEFFPVGRSDKRAHRLGLLGILERHAAALDLRHRVDDAVLRPRPLALGRLQLDLPTEGECAPILV